MFECGLFTDILNTHLLDPQITMHRLGILYGCLHTPSCLRISESVLASVSPGVLSGVSRRIHTSVSPGVLPGVSGVVLAGVPRSILASVSAGVLPSVSVVVLKYPSLVVPVIVSSDLSVFASVTS